jgi:acyl-CoA synthetase (AMP-forming)/AMP-acid ligase II
MLLVSGILENAARVAPDSVAATLGDDALTFGEIETRGNRLAHALLAHGLGRGDRVLWWGDTSLEAVPLFAAMAKIGAVFAPLNARSSVEEVRPVAAYARPRLLLATADYRDRAEELAERSAIPFVADLAAAVSGVPDTPPEV